MSTPLTTGSLPGGPVPSQLASPASLGSHVVAELRRSITGMILYPGDPDFADAALGHNRAVHHRPQAIVRAANAGDVEAAVRIAAHHQLPFNVLATGHGARPTHGGILLLTSGLTDLTIDAEAGTASIGAGIRWAAVVAAAAEFGLAPLCGSALDVGVMGYLLGGGIGPLARKHGFAVQQVLDFTVVTGDGLLRRVSAQENPDLFWALRGGKDGLGIVTHVTMKLVPVGPVFGGQIYFPAVAIEPVLNTWTQWVQSVPETVSSSVAIMRLPALPQIPAPLQGQCVALVTVLSLQEPAEGQETMAPLRAAAVPLIEMLQESTFAEWMQAYGEQAPAMPTWQQGRLLRHFTSETAATVLSFCGPEQQPPLMALEIRHLGGALNRGPALNSADIADGADGAFNGFEGQFLVNLLGVPAPELFADVIPDFAAALFTALGEAATGTSTINFYGEISTRNPEQLAWPTEIYARLQRIRQQYDPRSIFPASRSAEAA